MKLRVFIPPSDRPADAACAWTLRDARDAPLREGTSTIADMPRAGSVEAVLPAQRVLFAKLRLPRVNAATIRELLPYAVEDRLLADPAHIHAVAGATHARGETLVAVVDREWLSAVVQAFARAGLSIRSAWCESELLPRDAGEWHMVRGAGHGLLVDDEGVPATFDPGEGVPLQLRIALDEAASHELRPSRIRVHAAEGAPLPDLGRWSAECGVACEAAEPWEALRGRAPRAPLNLLQGDLAPRSAIAWRLPRAALALAAAIALVQLAFTAIDAWRLQRERMSLEARREAIFREAFPEARVVVDPDLQMARNLADLKRARGMVAGDEFLLQLTRAAERGAPVKTIDFANGRLSTR